MRCKVFSLRNGKEILRDPLSYILCLGFPVVMLAIMSIVNQSIPPEAHMELFQIENLAPGIAIFGFTFIMLFTTILVSKDRCGAFLTRLFSSPMTAGDYIGGYLLPMGVIAVAQAVITYGAAFLVAWISGESLPVLGAWLSILAIFPAAVLFAGAGLVFGTLFSDKAAPGLCSILISLSAMLGGIWMDVDTLGGAIQKVSHALPFYHAVAAGRYAISGDYGTMWTSVLIVALYGAVALVLAVLVFRRKMKLK